MEIEFPPKSAYDFDRSSVAFQAIVDGVKRRVLISQEALQDHFDAGDSDGDALVEVFKRNRSAIERVARQALSQVSEGDVILRTAHF